MKNIKRIRKGMTFADSLVGLLVICAGSLFYFEGTQIIQQRMQDCDQQLRVVRRAYEQHLDTKVEV
ncbi:type II secretion system protein [Fructilactobacillus cliffordii]|uniref:Type II secretion system protein n=1 Tax=Fructilactobacillus cliffordii TaxID=2940299 RepID=A0A9Q9E137_9LACO|nr:type II secretion system protein [Fructilactobacillus cliffordii]USS86785.1 type II secretion system protein [Fructilactobacillus cliffordii]USS89781.1 type II secretion system protein [Fructilactobacillus cliffordii]